MTNCVFYNVPCNNNKFFYSYSYIYNNVRKTYNKAVKEFCLYIFVPSSAEAEMLDDVKNLYRFLDGSIIRLLGYNEVNINVGMDKVSVCRASHRSLDAHQTISSQRRKPHLRRQNRPMSNPSLLPHHKNTKLRLAATSPISNSIIYADMR
ncbi:hypothetical protein ALC53_09184 [Atta colombica]|uniref:Uncharacterized protein n=1 Tax=Atta colombica TaxID=520822 RepID=A0A195B755_9HYME|nr:hypothetical protein ALC53_09184 [Atta colombica]